MRKDTLAAGARRATFAGGSGEGDIFRNVSKTPRVDAKIPKTVKKTKTRVFQPLGETILIRRAVVATETNLVVPDAVVKEQPSEGTVLAVGPKVDNISVNDNVVYGKYSGTEFKLNGEILLIMRQEDVQGIITGEN